MADGIESQGMTVLLITLFALFVILLGFLLLGFRREVVHGSRCPYCNGIMQFGLDVAKSLQFYVNDYLKEFPEADNPPIEFSSAAICPETGRIFSNCVKGGKKIDLDWSFLQKRFQGNFVSWGSLTEEEKGALRLIHGDIDGFQTEKSTITPLPSRIEPEFASTSPGPLYVDRKTKILMGWKKVHGTDFEVLVVQRPIYQSIEETL